MVQVDVHVLTHHDPPLCPHLSVMIIFVRLVYHEVKDLANVSFMLMIHCGMVKVVVQLAHAAHSTIHHGFVNNYLSQLMLIWRFDCVQPIVQ